MKKKNLHSLIFLLQKYFHPFLDSISKLLQQIMLDHFLMHRRATIFHDSIKNAKAIELLVRVCVIQSFENVGDCFSSFDFVASDHVAKLEHSLPVWFEQGVGSAFVQELFEVGFENAHSND